MPPTKEMTALSEAASPSVARRAARLLPNALTLTAAVCGITSIRFSSEGHFVWAALAIGAAALFDVADGFAARILNAETRLGAELDSLADFLNFGAAPAIFLYARDLHVLGTVGWAIAAVYVAATGFRLARYNVNRHQTSERLRLHSGLPSTAAALAVLAVNLAGRLTLTVSKAAVLDASACLITSAMMVSTLAVPTLAAAVRSAAGNTPER
jgi:CDP-diacylglycerol--serine O-phosphatidyltransferase